jgi:hypothetical protein
MMTRGFGRGLLAAGFLTLFAVAAQAQAIGSIFGKVTDTSGAVMPGVTVTVTGTGLQQPLVAVTTATGAYQFPSVPIGTYVVSFELQGFKKALRPNVIITTGFNAGIDQKLEIGNMAEELTVSAESPVVDLKKTVTGATFTPDTLEKIPTARDPWQIINMAPGVQAGLNVGGSSSGQQVGLSVYGSNADVQWNLEGGSITDLSSNSSPSYYNFDSLEQIQVVTGGGDVSVQSAGLSINLVTKSGSNTFKGSALGTFENDKMQSTNVTRELFESGTGGFLSGNPINRITNMSAEYGGPIIRDRLWFWGAADNQDINAGVLNYFNPNAGSNCATYAEAQRLGELDGAISFEQLEDVQKCLQNDKTVIKNLSWKINYQLNQANRFQYLFQSDNKVRDSRGASATTAREAVTQQFSDSPWKLPLPTHQMTHTWVATDRLVFNNLFTYVHGGFFLDYQDFNTCGQSRYLGATDSAAYQTGDRADPNCLWNQQSLSLRTTGFRSRSLTSSYQTVRHTWELKSDGTYFLSNRLGGDHSLKFGVGWRKAPIMSFSHYSGGARAWVQCAGNNTDNCADGAYVAPNSGPGLVPYRAELYRDQLLNNDWTTYFGYIQDGFSRGRWRINGGLRYDWQTSTYKGGCVAANPIRPDLLPAQCEDATDTDPITGRKLQSFGNWSPRVSATYDLFGNGKTSLRASGSFYYDTKITLANSLGGLATTTRLTWGSNPTSGACSTAAGASCWTDANRDGTIQANELVGTPTASSSRFDLNTGVLTPAGNTVDESARIARTREAIVGVQHELVPNLAVGVDYIYRYYDQGTADYTIGFQPGQPGFPLAQIYTGPIPYTDPTTGISSTYYEVCATCSRPSGLGDITVTDPNYEIYQGVSMTVNKRYSNRWQLNGSLTLQTNPDYYPEGSTAFLNPTGREFRHGVSTIARYLFKMSGSYDLPWGIMAAANLNINDGGVRILTIDAPEDVFGGLNASGQPTRVSLNSDPDSLPDTDEIEFQPADSVRFERTALLDFGLQKTLSLMPGRNRFRLKLMFDAFNVFNSNKILDFSSDNLSESDSSAPSQIVPPRVFRVGASITF